MICRKRQRIDNRLQELERKSRYYDLVSERYASEKELINEFESIRNNWEIENMKKERERFKNAHVRNTILILASFCLTFVFEIFSSRQNH